MPTDSYSLMVHGGAGALKNLKRDKTAGRYLERLRSVLEYGRQILSRGGSALEAVEGCASQLEDDPLFNAGRGSVLNELGRVELDAGIMDGRDLAAGAVAAVSNIANPIQLARLVMDSREHVLLSGEGAMRFAEYCGIRLLPDSYFVTRKRINQLEQARRRQGRKPDHDAANADEQDHGCGTIGAVARDLKGNLAAATSTGGTVNKRKGRIGDSPLIGAGVYADNQTCAVSATGYGEDLMRTVIAKTLADILDCKGGDARSAAKEALAYLKRKINGRGGFIVVDSQGNCASAFTTKRMIRGWIELGGRTICRF